MCVSRYASWFEYIASNQLPYLRQSNTHPIIKLNLCLFVDDFVDILFIFVVCECVSFYMLFLNMLYHWKEKRHKRHDVRIITSSIVDRSRNGKRKSYIVRSFLLTTVKTAVTGLSTASVYAWLTQRVTGGVFLPLFFHFLLSIVSFDVLYAVSSLKFFFHKTHPCTFHSLLHFVQRMFTPYMQARCSSTKLLIYILCHLVRMCALRNHILILSFRHCK